jgi:hypothetical protein
VFSNFLSYDPKTIDPAYREQMVEILKARGEILRISAEVSNLRARSWAGEAGADTAAELLAAGLAKARADYISKVRPFLDGVINLDKLKDLLPMLALAGLQVLNVPLPVILEALSVDVDNIKVLAEAIKELIEES